MSLSSQKNNTARIYNNKSKSNSKKNIVIKKDSKISPYELCKTLYQKNYSNPNPLLLSQIKEENLNIILSNLSPTDILILSEILKKYFYFKQIEISPYSSLKQDFSPNKKYKTNKDNIKENKEKQEKLRDKINKIFIGISKHLSLSNNLLSLSIINFELYSKYCLLLNKGLTANKSLQALKISHCLIQLDSYESLIKSLFNFPCLSYLDLSNNNLNDKYGIIISRLITKHSQRRDQIIWSYGLRNEKPPMNQKMGIISLNLSGNKLGNESADVIAKVLGTDQYLRAVYLNENKIGNNSCKKFIYMMRKNLSLLTIDLRGNPGYDDYIHSRLVMKMAKNMRYLYQQYKKGEFTEGEFENFKEFIDATFFDVDIPQEIVEFYNNNLPETSEENKEKNESESDIKDENNIDFNGNKNKIRINNLIDDEEKKEILLINRQLSEENLILKKQIKELKSKNNKKEENEENKTKDKEVYKKTESDIDSYYTRVEELINELNDIMNKIEKKQGENKNKINLEQENNIRINNNNNNNISNNMIKNEEIVNKKEDDQNILNKLLQKNNTNNNNNVSNNKSFTKTSPKLIEEKKGEEEKINQNISKEKEKEKETVL